MFKFIHAANIHLDSPLQGLERYDGAPVEEIRGATRKAFQNLVDLAIREEVDFIIIAGDIYDGDWKDHNTGLFFVSQMSQLRDAGIPVIMISGNHDAANKMTKTLPLPDNVELLSHKESQTAATVKLAAIGVAIHGRSFAEAAEFGNMVRDYPSKSNGLFNIGVLHTSLDGAEGHEPYAPCTIDELRQKQYDYWALGHVHNRRIVHQDPPIVFCGNLQGRHIREVGPKGCYLVTVDDSGKCTPQFEPLDVFRWELCTVNADGAARPDEVLSSFSSALADVMQQNLGFSIAVRVIVTGRCAAHNQLVADPLRWTNDIRALALDASGGNVWVEKVKFQTSLQRDPDSELPTDGPIGELLLYLSEVATDDTEIQELAKDFADLRRKLPNELINVENGVAFDDPVELRNRLAEVEPLLLSRLMEDC